jgi:hypothetical protein
MFKHHMKQIAKRSVVIFFLVFFPGLFLGSPLDTSAGLDLGRVVEKNAGETGDTSGKINGEIICTPGLDMKSKEAQIKTSAKFNILNLKPTQEICRFRDQTRLSFRSFDFDKKPARLLADPETLKSEMMFADCLKCEAISHAHGSLTDIYLNSRFKRVLELATSAPFPIQNDGLTHANLDHEKSKLENHEQKGSILTVDLCPSAKPLDRDFFSSLDNGANIAFAASGLWLKQHPDDIFWLKDIIRSKNLNITWINHSYRHRVQEGLSDENNLLRLPGTNLKLEVLRTEEALLAQGFIPSVLFRFPGLISDEALLTQLKAMSLIPIGSEA